MLRREASSFWKHPVLECKPIEFCLSFTILQPGAGSFANVSQLRSQVLCQLALAENTGH